MITNIPLAHLGGLTAEEFLRDYWQKKPLLVRNAFPNLASLVGKEDLMELAQEDSVEARIILEKDVKNRGNFVKALSPSNNINYCQKRIGRC